MLQALGFSASRLRGRRLVSSAASAASQLCAIPEFAESEKLVATGCARMSDGPTDVCCARAEACVGRARDIVSGIPGPMGDAMRAATLRRFASVSESCGRPASGLRNILRLQGDAKPNATTPDALLDKAEVLIARARASLHMGTDGTSGYPAVYSYVLAGIDAAEDAAGGCWTCPSAGHHDRAISYAEAALTGARLHALGAVVSCLSAPFDVGTAPPPAIQKPPAVSGLPEGAVAAIEAMRASAQAASTPETGKDRHLEVATTLVGHINVCGELIAGAPGAGVTHLRFAVFLRARAAIALATARLNAAAAQCITAGLVTDEPAVGGPGIPSQRDPSSLVASAHTLLSQCLDDLGDALREVQGLKREGLTEAGALAFRRAEGDMQWLRARAQAASGELALLSGLQLLWGGLLGDAPAATDAAAPPAPVFPLSPSDADALAPVLRASSEACDRALKDYERLRARSPAQEGALEVATCDHGREEPLTLLARPLRLIGVLQHVTQKAVMAEGLFATVADSLEAASARAAKLSAQQQASGAAPDASSGDSWPSGSAPPYPALPLLASAALAAPLLHSYGVLLSQWERREGQAASMLAGADAHYERALGALLAGSPGKRVQLAPPVSKRGFLQRQLISAGMATLQPGSFGFVLPLDVAALNPPA